MRHTIRWNLFQRFLAIACIILFIPFTIAFLIVIGLIPVYLSNHANSITRSTTSEPFNVTYMVMDSGGVTFDNFDKIDLDRLARSFERGLNLKIQNILKVSQISSPSGTRRKRASHNKRKRFFGRQLLTFLFNLIYPRNRFCQSQSCIDQTFNNAQQQFQNTPSLTVDMNDVPTELELYTGQDTSDATEISTIVSTSITTSTTTSTSNTDASASQSTEPITTSSWQNSNTTSNDMDVPIDVCLLKQPIIQESVPPYRITHTSTLFYRANLSLLIIGAWKIEQHFHMNQLQQEIHINGILVYKNCQRTIETTLPLVCPRAFSS